MKRVPDVTELIRSIPGLILEFLFSLNTIFCSDHYIILSVSMCPRGVLCTLTHLILRMTLKVGTVVTPALF